MSIVFTLHLSHIVPFICPLVVDYLISTSKPNLCFTLNVLLLSPEMFSLLHARCSKFQSGIENIHPAFFTAFHAKEFKIP